jgi:hypothetical protein
MSSKLHEVQIKLNGFSLKKIIIQNVLRDIKYSYHRNQQLQFQTFYKMTNI